MATLNKFLRENKVSKMTKAERNAWYNSLTAPQKAVAICEDVLLQIANKKYVMTSGVYAQIKLDSDIKQRTVNDIFKKTQLDELIGAKSVTCRVCAMGSAFMSAVRLGNKVESECALEYAVEELVDKNWGETTYLFNPGGTADVDFQQLEEKLEEAFTEEEFRAMEFMFEGRDINATWYGNHNAESILQELHDNDYEHLYSTEKMIKMCKQIIKDKGYFLVEGVDLKNESK